MLRLLIDGLLLCRYAERQKLASPPQRPPRVTRLEPEFAPLGFSTASLDVFHHTCSLHDFIFSAKATATAAFSCLFVIFVVQKIKKFVFIRVHSWF